MTSRILLAVSALALASTCAPEPSNVAICSVTEFEGDRFTTCPFDARKQRISLVWQSPAGANYGDFQTLSRYLPSSAVAYAMNAGMFDAAGAPIGLYIEDGNQLHAISMSSGAGNFHMKPNGVFWVDAAGDPHVSESQEYLTAGPAPALASQSGPMLVIDGKLHPAFQHDGASRYVRNGVGVTGRHSATFVISERPVSFGKLARFFRDEMNCSDALYFDGAVSSLWAPSLGRQDTGSRLGPMVVVQPR